MYISPIEIIAMVLVIPLYLAQKHSYHRRTLVYMLSLTPSIPPPMLRFMKILEEASSVLVTSLLPLKPKIQLITTNWLRDSLHADDVRAHVREHHAAERPRPDSRQFDDSITSQRPHSPLHRLQPPPRMVAWHRRAGGDGPDPPVSPPCRARNSPRALGSHRRLFAPRSKLRQAPVRFLS